MEWQPPMVDGRGVALHGGVSPTEERTASVLRDRRASRSSRGGPEGVLARMVG